MGLTSISTIFTNGIIRKGFFCCVAVLHYLFEEIRDRHPSIHVFIIIDSRFCTSIWCCSYKMTNVITSFSVNWLTALVPHIMWIFSFVNLNTWYYFHEPISKSSSDRSQKPYFETVFGPKNRDLRSCLRLVFILVHDTSTKV